MLVTFSDRPLCRGPMFRPMFSGAPCRGYGPSFDVTFDRTEGRVEGRGLATRRPPVTNG